MPFLTPSWFARNRTRDLSFERPMPYPLHNGHNHKWISKILQRKNQGSIINKPCDIASEQGWQPALWQTASHLCIEQFFSLLQVWVHLTSTCLMHFTFWYERRQLQCLDMYALQGGQGPGWQSLKKKSNHKLKKLENSTYVYRNNKVDDTLAVVTNIHVHVYRNLSRIHIRLYCDHCTTQSTPTDGTTCYIMICTQISQ